MQILSNQQIATILREYAVSVDAKSSLVAGIQVYVSLLRQWNRSISLTTVTDPEEIVRFHFGESLFAASVAPIADGRLADVGSGAGFPGLPLKMLLRGLDLTLIESNSRRATFLAELVRRLSLEGVHVFRGRMEEFKGGPDLGSATSFDFITARAFGHFDHLLALSRQHLAKSGRLVLWLGQQDVTSISKVTGWTWEVPVRIPGSDRRFIVVGTAHD
jgi:16S rRNA (guanine527-N7)-methyltransferase